MNNGMTSWMPSYVKESHSGVREIELMSQSLTDRKVYILGDITDDTLNSFLLQIQFLSKSSEPIDIYINSPGGQINAGLAVYDIIQSLDGKVPINMYCVGLAASMAALIFAGGQKGRRYILPHSKCLIHEPLIAGGLGGSATSIKKTAEDILEIRKLTNSILAKHTGRTIKQIDKATEFDNMMTAEEAVKFGICDEIKSVV
ncbi:MAG: ATP-dependent Clp protease proteolytic subunit [Lachnospiraceae bacterium]|nr:ATP-dependent Clp protease proteolytic subunit [Lachnospiraceae bacterium]